MPPPAWHARAAHRDALIDAVLKACDPARLVDQAWDVAASGPVTLVAAGKASVPMAAGALRRVGMVKAGLVVGPAPAPGFESFEVDHPLATERNVRAAERVESLVTGLGADDSLVLLLSGGSSAHLTLPVPGVTLDDLRDVSDRLMRAGATIDDLNTVRKHVERLKGGRLGSLAHPARVTVLVLSDVVGDRLDVIGSGPAVADPTTCADALQVLRRYQVDAPAIETYLCRGIDGAVPDTPKPGSHELAHVRTTIVGSRATALHAAVEGARRLGFTVRHTNADVTGSAAEIGVALAGAGTGPGAWIIAGETTVGGVAPGARGGPAQELALAASTRLSERAMLVSFATDGVDGPTNAAGACVDSATVVEMRARGIDPHAVLAAHEAHDALEAVGALIVTGPTGTNVNDIAVLLVYD